MLHGLAHDFKIIIYRMSRMTNPGMSVSPKTTNNILKAYIVIETRVTRSSEQTDSQS